MKRGNLVRKIAARRRLCGIAFELAPHVPRGRLERELRLRAPGLVRLVGEREVEAVIALASRPLGSA